jgi:polar amino acid transport system substrate-binding protein
MRAWALACVLATLAGRASADTLDDVKRRGVLRWGGDIQGGEPYVYEDTDQPGRLVGFEVEIADALARRLGVKATFVQSAWSNLLPGHERGDYDSAMHGLELSPERARRPKRATCSSERPTPGSCGTSRAAAGAASTSPTSRTRAARS